MTSPAATLSRAAAQLDAAAAWLDVVARLSVLKDLNGDGTAVAAEAAKMKQTAAELRSLVTPAPAAAFAGGAGGRT